MEYKILSGRYGNLTSEQEQLLRQFILKVKKEGLYCEERHDIHCFLRFLRARSFDLDKSFQMFHNCEQWRKENNIEDLYKNFSFPELDKVEKIYPKFYHNVDRLGRPIYIEQFGNLNVKKLFEATTEERLLNYVIHDYEYGLHQRFPSCSNAAGHHVETGLTIMDLKDAGLMQFSKCFNFIKKTSKVASDYYPECMGNLFVINAPKAFTMCWKVIKGILDPVTAEKIQILGKNYESVLLKYAAPENLPKIYGGTCECAGGCSHSNVGPWNDPNYNMQEKMEITVDEFLRKFVSNDSTLNETITEYDSEYTLSEFNKLEPKKDQMKSDNLSSNNTLPSPPHSPLTTSDMLSPPCN